METEGEALTKASSCSPSALRCSTTQCFTNDAQAKSSAKTRRKPGGWKSMPYILGNETFERLASLGLLANFMVYLRKVYHLDQVSATSLIGLWTGVTNFSPLIGAFLSDAYLGRYWTIAVASIFSFLGMVTMTLTAWLPALHPAACDGGGKCEGPTSSQMGFLIMTLCLLAVGTAGIRPCSIPFGVDQFDPTTDKGRKGISSFYNWYYATFTVVLVFALTVVVFIQDSVSWVLGFGIPAIFMFCSVVLFFVGTRVYVLIKPAGSIFTGLAQVAAAAYKKRNLKLPDSLQPTDRTAFYDPPLDTGTAFNSKLPLTTQFRFLNKAAIVMEKELNPDGSRVDKWRLCTIQQVEELKCLIRVSPIWVAGILTLTPLLQQATFSVSQALQMDRHIGPKFQIPPGSIIVMSFITIVFWIPIYDRLLVPALRKLTHHESGITPLQRIGVGIIIGVASMIVAGLVEMKRRNWANKSVHMSVFWLLPQFILLGLCEAFNIIGQIEFFNKEFPESMRTMGNALSSCSVALTSYINTAMVLIVHKTTGGRQGKPDWLADDLNAGRLDYFYYVVAATAFLNLFLFLYCAKHYQYKGSTFETQDDAQKPPPCEQNLELLTSAKKLDV